MIHSNRIVTCIKYLSDSDTVKTCWYWPDTYIYTDTRIGAALPNTYVDDT